ncbi:MAG: DUF2520 domain-containing protein [Candidatus Edwardsbacteria bacterium]
MEKPKVSIIGAGRVGTALAVLLSRRGYKIVGVSDESLEVAKSCADQASCSLGTTDSAEVCQGADIILITTPDSVLQGIAEGIAAKKGFKKGQFVIHTSGLLSSKVLSPARFFGAYTLSMHPIQTFAKISGEIPSLAGTYFVLEGDSVAIEQGKQIVADLDGFAVTIPPEAKMLHHTACSLTSNYLVTLLFLAQTIYEKIGISEDDSEKMLLPLLKGTIKNIEELGVQNALTGPIERGDLETVKKHLEVLETNLPELLKLYKELGRYTVELMKRKQTIPEEKTNILKDLFRI